MLREIKRLSGGVAAAALCACSFPAGQFACLAFVALVPLILVAEEGAVKGSFLRGYTAGSLFFVTALFWIGHVTVIGLLLLSAYLALYWGFFSAGVAWSSSWAWGVRLVFLPALWTALEYIRAHLFTGFGWAALAHTQSANIPLIQMANVTGVYGVSWAVLVVNVVIARWVHVTWRREKVPRLLAGVTLVLVLMVVAGMGWKYVLGGDKKMAGRESFRVALIQPNIALADYANPLLKVAIVEKHLALSREAMRQGPQMIVWPESAFPAFIWEYPALFEKVCDFARENHVQLLAGAVTRNGGKYFNSALLINENGVLSSTYSKQHLVLLGEYIPLRKAFPLLERLVPIDDFTPGTGRGIMGLMPAAAGEPVFFAPLICFEDTLPDLARLAVKDGAGFLVNLTNDAWFKASRQSRMHLNNAVFRAVENGVPLVRATNTGMTCAISPAGVVSGCAVDAAGRSVMAEGVAVVDIVPESHRRTFYTQHGDVFAGLCFLIVLGLSVFFKCRYAVPCIRQNQETREV